MTYLVIANVTGKDQNHFASTTAQADEIRAAIDIAYGKFHHHYTEEKKKGVIDDFYVNITQCLLISAGKEFFKSN